MLLIIELYTDQAWHYNYQADIVFVNFNWKNSPNSARHGLHQVPEGVLWCLAPRCLQVIQVSVKKKEANFRDALSIIISLVPLIFAH